MTLADAACGLTVLRCVGDARATKRWVWRDALGAWSKVSYEAGAWFHAEEYRVASLTELAAVLEQVRLDPRAFVVRGALSGAGREQVAKNRPILRRKHQKRGVLPTLVETARRWLMIDIDGWPLPTWTDLADDPDTVIDHAIHELLPVAFHEAECWWQLSSSAGFVPGTLKAHAFFWLSEAAGNEHIKQVLHQHAPGVDRAPFNAAQPHFIGAPIVEGGADPLPRRTGWRRGTEPQVALPALIPNWRPPRPEGSGAATGGLSGSVAAALAVLGDGERREGFHAPLRTAILRYARDCRRGAARDDEALKSRLRKAIRSVPHRPDRDIENPYCMDAYLQSSIDGAFALLSADPDTPKIDPQHTAPSHTVEQARATLAEHVGAFMQRTLGWHRARCRGDSEQPSEHAALRVDVGLGKTTIVRESLAAFIAGAKGEDRTKTERAFQGTPPHRVLWLVPTHRLGAEALVAMTDLGLNVAVMRGREAEVPGTGNPDDDIPPEKMCLNLPAVEDAIRICEDVERAVCGGRKKDSSKCPFFGQCHYQRQKKALARADIVIASHQALFHKLPALAGACLGLVVVDEGWWQSGVQPNRELRLAGFADEPLQQPVLRKAGVEMVASMGETNDLHALCVKAQEAFGATPDGELVSRAAVLAAGLTADDCDLAVKLEWRRKIEGVLHPGMTPARRKKAVEQAAGNAALPRRAGIWRALAGLLRGEATYTGRLQMGRRGDAQGAGRVVLLHSRREVLEDIAALPLLLLDATLPADVVRHFLPRLDVLADVQARTPHMHVHQILGGWGKTSLVPHERQPPEENRRRKRRLSELADFVRLNSSGNGLVVTYEAIESGFAGPGIQTAHFNAISGLDRFRGVRSLFVIGRPLPDPREMLALARAVTGRPIAAEDGQVETRGALMVDGTGTPISVRVYADRDLEAIRSAITDAEVMQAIGRGRGVNREAATPLDVFVCADVVLPLPVAKVVRWEDARPTIMGRMLAHGAVLFSPADAARAYHPDLFTSEKAAQKALERCGADFDDIPLGLVIPREMSPKSLPRATYRPRARGQQTRRALVAPWRVEGFRAWLESLFGPLAAFQLDGQAEAPATPSTPENTRMDPAAIMALADSEKLALRAHLQARAPKPSPDVSAPLVAGCAGLALPISAMLPVMPGASATAGFWTIHRRGALPIHVTDRPEMAVLLPFRVAPPVFAAKGTAC